MIFAGLGDKDRTLEALGRMAVVGPVRMGSILSLQELALLRGDPRLNFKPTDLVRAGGDQEENRR